MTVGFSLIMLLLLLSGDIFKQAVKSPPRDLASLLDAKTVLTRMEVKTDEESLIAILGASTPGPNEEQLKKAVTDLGAQDFATRRQAAQTLKEAGPTARPLLEQASQSEDPEVRLTAQGLLKELDAGRTKKAAANLEYLKKLMAVRVLEKMKSQRALPALDALAKEKDITLADAAGQAALVIRGQPVNRPSGRELLKDLSIRLPIDLGFVAVLDLERNVTDKTVAEYFADAKKALEKRLPPEKAEIPELSELRLDEATWELAKVVAETGNIRVDALVIAVSTDIGTDNGYIAFIFKGLADPERLQRTLFNRFVPVRVYRDNQVFYKGGDLAACFLDEHTFVVTMAENPHAGGQQAAEWMDRILEPLVGDKRTVQPPATAEAFDLVIEKGHRLAAAGALTDAQKELIRKVMTAELDRAKAKLERARGDEIAERTMEMAAAEAGLNLTRPDRFSGYVDMEGNVHVEAQCPDEKSAAETAGSFSTLEKELRRLLQVAFQRRGHAPAAFGEVDWGKPFWSVEAVGKVVRGSLDITVPSVLLPQFLGFRMGPVAPPQRMEMEAVPMPVERLP